MRATLLVLLLGCTTPRAPLLANRAEPDPIVSMIGYSYFWTCDLHRSGTVLCHAIYDLQPPPDVVELAGSCLTTRAGAHYCTDGVDPFHPLPRPRALPDPDTVEVSAATCTRNPDRTVTCRGSNAYGESGDADPSPAPRPVAGLTSVRQLAAAGESACALRDDGGVWCWGGRTWSHHGERPPARACRHPTLVAGLHDIVRIWMTVDTLCGIDAQGGRTCLSDSPREAALYHAASLAHWLDGCR